MCDEVTAACRSCGLELRCDLRNIVRVVDDGLCTGCGTCAGVCPVNAVSMRVSGGLYLPEVADSCTDCGLCLKCCSGYSANLNEFESVVSEGKRQDVAIGDFVGCYIGHSNNEGTLNDSTSGGVVTELLVYALEKGLIDGALVVRMRKDKPLEPEPFVARSREEIVSASKAKYCPVPMNVALKTILSEEGRFAVVGLPCHIYGVRKAEAALPQLKSRIVLHIGLFCSHPASFSGTECLLRKFGIEKDQVEKLDYRGNGWPSRMSIGLKDGRSLSVRFNRSWHAYWNVFSSFFFAPVRCIMCGNQFNELSDVSFGDAWLPELRRSKKGESVIVVRTTLASELLSRMKQNGVISLRNVSPVKVKESQAFSVSFKKGSLSGRLALLRLVGKKTPNMQSKLSLSTFPGAFLTYLSYRSSSSNRFRSSFTYVPLPLFRLYFGLFKYACLLSK